MRILNLYSGIGGNRKMWGDNHSIISVEINPKIANIYQQLFPNDTIIIEDAHLYLLNHFLEFDFIWSSPPCQSHSSFRYNIGVRFRGVKPEYPDLNLYEEILFLKYHAKCKWIVENVRPYYEPLIKPTSILQRHLIWSNFNVPIVDFDKDNIRRYTTDDFQTKFGFDLSKYKIENKRQVLRNCVDPEIGQYVLQCANNSLII